MTDLPRVIPPTRSDAPDPIVGGRATREFPDCCAVGDAEGFFCSGTLVAPTVVVTAKHCEGASRVFLRGWDVSDPSTAEIIDVERQFEHDTLDLRVLVLVRPSSVPPRHIAQGPEARGTVAHLVGFGTVDLAGRRGYGIKREVDVPIASLECLAEAPRQYGCLPGAELVAGHRGLAVDSCRGDSGGPLYVQAPTGHWNLLGVTSRGVISERVCGDGGVYVRLDQQLNWLRAVTLTTYPGPR